MLKSSSAPAAYSSFEDIGNAISCCFTGSMLTVTDEQEGTRAATSSGVAQSARETSKDRTEFLTAGIRGKAVSQSHSSVAQAEDLTSGCSYVHDMTTEETSATSRLPPLVSATTHSSSPGAEEGCSS